MSRIIFTGFIVPLALIPGVIAQPALAETPDEIAAALDRFENGVIARMERGHEDPARHTIEARLSYHEVPGVAVAMTNNLDSHLPRAGLGEPRKPARTCLYVVFGSR